MSGTARVSSFLLERQFGIRLSDRQVRRILRQLGWTRQKPERQAVQRDEEAIHSRLTHRWPYLKRYAHRTHRLILFIDETGLYLLPSIVNTWAPRGETPILQEMLSHEHLSVISAVSRHGDIYYYQQAQSFNSDAVIAFLDAVHQRMPEQKLLVIWDGAPIHWSQTLQQYLAEGASAWLRLEKLPGYAPESNPDEGVAISQVYRTAQCLCDDVDAPGGSRKDRVSAYDRIAGLGVIILP